MLNQDVDIWIRLGSSSIQTLAGVLVFDFILRLAWKLVGGKAKFERFLITYAYYASAIVLLLVLASLCADGVIKVFDPSLYELLRSGDQQAIQEADPVASSTYLSGLFVLVLGFVIASIWSFVGWGGL